NSLRMHTGAGSAPMLQAATAWTNLADELGGAANSFSSVTSGLTSQAWQGASAQAMTAPATPYSSWLHAASAPATSAGGPAQAVASAFEAALQATVHPGAVLENRSVFTNLVRSNFFGFLAPYIAEAEFDYEAMWAQDVTAMVGYYGQASTAAANLTP